MVELKLESIEEQNLPRDCFISVRVGQTQRLSRLEATQLYRFPEAGNRRFSKIEVYRRIGACSVDIDPSIAGLRDISVNCNEAGFGSLGLRIGVAADAESKKEHEDLLDQQGKKAHSKKKAAKEYLAKHGLEVRLCEAMQSVLHDRPESPTEYLAMKLLGGEHRAATLPPLQSTPRLPEVAGMHTYKQDLNSIVPMSQKSNSLADWRLDWLAGKHSNQETFEALRTENASLRNKIDELTAKLKEAVRGTQINAMNPVPTEKLQKLSDVQPQLEESLRVSLDADGFLNDLVECTRGSLAHPKAIGPFESFGYKLYSSRSATAALRALLRCELPGTGVSFQTAISAVESGSLPTGIQQHHCYLVGGQVRDVLRGVLSKDVDFNYTCEAREVAVVATGRGWPTKFFRINAKDDEVPNYACIGDTGTDNYLEGFCVTFNATKPCYIGGDFRQNMCYYDLTNDVIIDKTGFSVSDIRARALRLSCADAPGETFDMWAAESVTEGYMQLRYVKFLLRAIAKGQPLRTDPDELAFVIKTLRRALKDNADALIQGPLGFGYALSANLKDAKGVNDLKAWVSENGDEAWWQDAWVPLVCACGGQL